MPCEKTSREGFVYLDNLSINNPLPQLVDLVQICEPYLSGSEIKSLILERERIGDTFIGQKTVIFHVTTTILENEFCLYVYSLKTIKWQSLATKNIYKVNKFIILGIDPKSECHCFRRLKNVLQVPEELEQMSGICKDFQLNTINWF